MAIKVGGTTVIDDSRNVDNIGTIKGLTYPSADGTAGQFLKTDGAGNLAFQTVQTDPTLATLTKSFSSGESASLSLSSAISTAPVVSVIKEVPQVGVSSKGTWDVAADGANYTRHDTASDTTLTPEGWRIANASFSQSFSVSSQDSNPQDVFFKPDGTKMYTIGRSNDRVYEYDLDTAWDVSSASFNQNFSVATQDTSPQSVFFKPDGLKMYILGDSGNAVDRYSLTTEWDISTATQDQYFAVGSQDAAPGGLFFKPDGLKMYVAGSDNNAVFEYNLSTAWDITSATYSQNFNVNTQESTVKAVHFKSDGTKMYVTGTLNDEVHEYDLSTAWDVSTASFNVSFDVSSQDLQPQGVFFKTDGLRMYIAGSGNDNIYEYNVPSVFILGTGSFASSDLGKTIEGNGGKAVLTNTNGLYTVVTEFTDSSQIASGDWGMFSTAVSAANGLELSNTSNLFESPGSWSYDSVNVVLEETSPGPNPSFGGNCQGLFFKPDGTKLFISNTQSDDVYEYALSTAWDITTASYTDNFPISQDTNPLGIFFKPDGLKFYLIGSANDTLYEYDLSTAWDLTTASYNSVSKALTDTTGPYGLFFKSDGLKMYVSDSSQDNVREYALTTAWAISTASSVTTFSNASIDTIRGIGFSEDGTLLLVGMAGTDKLHGVNLSTAWDLSTASYSGDFLDFTAQDGDIGVPLFKPDGTKGYILDTGAGGEIYQYSTGTSFVPTSQYSVSVTNVGGQIDSEYWTDINTMTADQDVGDGEVYYAVSTDSRTTWSVIKDSDGVRPIVRNNAGTWEYNSNTTYGSTTWTSATTNAELDALQQALGATGANRMLKAQLDAVTDPNHYTLGDRLDLMIALYQGTASLDVPSSDGVTINYDAEVLNQGALIGTDYDIDIPDSSTVRVTSNATQNLKIRVV